MKDFMLWEEEISSIDVDPKPFTTIEHVTNNYYYLPKHSFSLFGLVFYLLLFIGTALLVYFLIIAGFYIFTLL